MLGSSIYVSMIADFFMGITIGNVCVQTTGIVREKSSRENNSNMMGLANGGASLMSQVCQWISGLLFDFFLLSNTANFSFSVSFAFLGIPFFISIIVAGLSSSTKN